MLIDTRSVQRFLAANGQPIGADGDWGGKSKKAARVYLGQLGSVKTSYRAEWPDGRVRVAVEQAMIAATGQDLGKFDGIAGVRTQIGLERWQDWITFERPPLQASAVAYQKTVWPRQRDIRAFYGEPGDKTKQTMLESPYPLFLDWELSAKVTRFSIHEKCHDSAKRVMERVLSHYGLDQIHDLGLDQFGGCLNVRKMRNGTSWSTHAWGIAIDWDADRNPLRTPFARSQMGKPEYAPFLDLWEEEGWISLGRARNFDAMHVQAARL